MWVTVKAVGMSRSEVIEQGLIPRLPLLFLFMIYHVS